MVRPLQFYQTLRFLLDKLGPNRIMFASDWAARKDAKLYAKWVNSFRQIPPMKEAGIEFTEAEISNLLGKNAIRILKL